MVDRTLINILWERPIQENRSLTLTQKDARVRTSQIDASASGYFTTPTIISVARMRGSEHGAESGFGE